MTLSVAQKQELIDNGYVKVPGIVPRAMLDAALRAINSLVGKGLDGDEMTELHDAAVITDLLMRTPAWELAESAIGSGRIDPPRRAQIALRFPSLEDPPPEPIGHLDGMHSEHNGVPKGEIRNFTMLVGIYLSDVPESYAGNFTVWPGTHHAHERYFREHGAKALLDGMPPIDLPPPVHVTGAAGDVILAHYQVAHTAVTNVSPHTRYAVFFRLRHVGHPSFRPEAMTDIWLDWEGLRDLAPRAGGRRITTA